MQEAPSLESSGTQHGRTFEDRLRQSTFLPEEGSESDHSSSKQETRPGMTPFSDIIKFRDCVLEHVYSIASREAQSVAMVAARNAVASAVKVAENRIHVTCDPEVKRIAVDLVSHELRLAIGSIASRPIVAQYAPLYVGRVVTRSLVVSEDRQKALAKRVVADSVQIAQHRISEGIVADIVRIAHDRLKVASEVAIFAVSALTSRALSEVIGPCLVVQQASGELDEPSVCPSSVNGSVSGEADQAVDENLDEVVDENLDDTDDTPDDDDFESYTSDAFEDDQVEEEDHDMARESLGRAYKKGLLCSSHRADRRLQSDLQGLEQDLIEPSKNDGVPKSSETISAIEEQPIAVEDTVVSTSFPEPCSTEDTLQQDIHAPTLPEASPTRMVRPDSLRMLAALYGPVADQKLAQRPNTTPGTAGSMLSARSTSAGQPTAGRSGFTSAIPTPPSTAKPQKMPAHRLAKRAQSRPNTQTAEERAGTHLINATHDPEKLRELDQRRLRRKFLKNRELCKNQQSQMKHSEAVVQEYHWRLREMEVEKQCRSVENKWHRRELKRREGVEMKRQDLAEKGDNVLNLRYGRFYASPYSQQVAAYPSNAESEQASQAGESELDVMWEAEALGVFQAAYNEAVGRFIDRSEDLQQVGNAEVDGASTSQDSIPQERPQSTNVTNMLKSLPKGRVEWNSPRNPWCPRRNVPQPSVEAVIASLLGGECSTETSSAGRPSPTPSGFGQKQERPSSSPWKKLPPVVPRRAIHDR